MNEMLRIWIEWHDIRKISRKNKEEERQNSVYNRRRGNTAPADAPVAWVQWEFRNATTRAIIGKEKQTVATEP